MMDSCGIEFRTLSREWKRALADFFDILKSTGDDKYFHPHPFTIEEATRRCNYSGNDLYYICTEGKTILAYAMIRGWDEGYAIPSLGLAIHPAARSIGLGKAFIHFLHVMAYRRGARRIRIKVYPDNRPAIELYKKIGYKFEEQEGEQYVGFFNLD